MKKQIATIISNIVVCLVFGERFYSYAQIQDEHSFKNPQDPYPKIQTRTDACHFFAGKIITFYDQAAILEDCKQRPIENTEVLNELVKFQHIEVKEVPARIYRMFPLGRDFTRADLPDIKKKIRGKISEKECKELNEKFISTDGMKYFYVSKCTRFALGNMAEPNQPVSKFTGFITVSPELLEKILLSNKPYTEPGPSEDKLLFNIDGQPQWSGLTRAKTQKSQNDTPSHLAKLQEEFSKPLPKEKRCTKWNKKIVSFYSEIFFVENCTLRPVTEYSIEVQQLIEKHGGVADLDTDDYKDFKKGTAIAHKELSAKLK